MPAVQTMPSIHISTRDVELLLQRIQPHKASGPDMIPARVMKECASSIAPPRTEIFRRSLQTGDVPPDWRDAIISPVFNKGGPDDPANYRPISLTSIASKLLEHIVHKAVMDHLDNLHLLSNVQHGFRKECSCETQLSTVIQDNGYSLELSQQVDAIILDFSKVFDTVPRHRLLYKLSQYGIRGNTLQ